MLISIRLPLTVFSNGFRIIPVCGSCVRQVGHPSGRVSSTIPRELLQPQGQLREGIFFGKTFESHVHVSSLRYLIFQDLSQLGRPISDTIIIDNSPASYIFHPNNAVPVSSWFNDPHDTELTDLCPFLADLGQVDDVRGVLDGGL